MKHALLTLVMLLSALVLTAQTGTLHDLSAKDLNRLEKAVELMDNGMPETAIDIIETLVKVYPDNYDIMYELGYAYNVTGDYDKLLKLCNQLKKHPRANFQVYQMEGNTLDYMGKRKEAIEAYNEGLKRFPDAGMLYVEQAIISEHEQDYDQAVMLYEKAIEVEPDLASPYYHLAKLYAMSTEPVWALLYGEVACLLEPGSNRSNEMSKLMYDIYQDHIQIDNEQGTINTTLTETHTININQDTSIVKIPLPLGYEVAMLRSLAGVTSLDLKNLVEVKRRFTEEFHEMYKDYYDVPILDFDYKVFKNGYWEPYCMWLLQKGDEKAYEKWLENDSASAAMDAFITWYNQDTFKPTKERPTLRTQVYLKDRLNIPPFEEIGDADGCRKHKLDAQRLARWVLEQPFDTTSTLKLKVNAFIITWATNSDEVSLTLRDSPVGTSPCGVMATICALIDYAITNNVKDPGEEGFRYAVKTAIAYMERNGEELSEEAKSFLNMTSEQQNQLLHQYYIKN